jgi:hypothetical protein
MYLRSGVEKYMFATSIVMPCSRSAIRPSVNKDKSKKFNPLRFEADSNASILSLVIDFVSYKSRPINVLLPSSTEPAVAILSISIAPKPPEGVF